MARLFREVNQKRGLGAVAFFVVLATVTSSAWAEKRSFEMSIEDTKITLVDKQDFDSFAFNGQVRAPLILVK